MSAFSAFQVIQIVGGALQGSKRGADQLLRSLSPVLLMVTAATCVIISVDLAPHVLRDILSGFDLKAAGLGLLVPRAEKVRASSLALRDALVQASKTFLMVLIHSSTSNEAVLLRSLR